MKCSTLFSIVGIALLGVACTKELPPQPEPVLQGRWNFRSTVTYSYDGSGQLLSKDEQFPGQYGAFYLVITADSLKYVKTSDDSSLGAYKIIRNGNEIQIPRLNRKPIITVLTTHDLSLRFNNVRVASTGHHDDLEDNYVR